MDGFSLDGILTELRPRLLGRYVRRVTLFAEQALALDISGEREMRLVIVVTRGVSSVGLLDRATVRRLTDDARISGRERHALLLFRKHLERRRFDALERIAGERTLVLKLGEVALVFRPSGPAPALSLVLSGTLLTTLGEGQSAWPLPEAHREREWNKVDLDELARIALSVDSGRPRARAILAACPPLGPFLAGMSDGTVAGLSALRVRLREIHPTLVSLRPLEECRESDLAQKNAVVISPISLDDGEHVCRRYSSWLEAMATFMDLTGRGRRFAVSRHKALEAERREVRRLAQLETHLERDLARLPDAEELRKRAEALLAWSGEIPRTSDKVMVPDPRECGRWLPIGVNPRLTRPQNANQLYDKARRIERAREMVNRRLAQARAALVDAHAEERRALVARSLDDLDLQKEVRHSGARVREERAQQRRYLTSRGLTILVGRGARENHQLTFEVARPEDFWLHVRDAAGAHVILRDPERRAHADDLRESAEVAAFFSDLQRATHAEVHVTRRKHVKPAGGLGRVRVAHSDTLRVAPLDPDARLRRF